MKNPKKKKSAKKLGKSGSVKKAGLPPGSLIHIGQVKTDKTSLDLVIAEATSFEVKRDISLEQVLSQLDQSKTNWIRVVGLQNADLIGELGRKLNLHTLFLEDILNTGQRPKAIVEEDMLFFTLKTLGIDNENAVVADQVSFVLKKNILISFHESDLSIFSSIYKRFEVTAGKLRTSGADYLLYALTDIIVDHYFQVLENTANALDQIEEALLSEVNEQILDQIQHNRKELIFVKKAVFPLREALAGIQKADAQLIDYQHVKYFNDISDHVMQIFETVENYRELNTSLKDLYLSELSHRMNKVMQVLTIIATIFIPLTFIAGIYGMNFENIPELKYKYGYFVVWLVMLGIAGWMLILFRKNKWL